MRGFLPFPEHIIHNRNRSEIPSSQASTTLPFFVLQSSLLTFLQLISFAAMFPSPLLLLASSAGLSLSLPFTPNLSPRSIATFPAGTTWDILLSTTPDLTSSLSSSSPSSADTNFQVIDVDLFDTSAATIAELKKDYRVICYFSAGTREGWRPDVKEFEEGDFGGAVEGGPNGAWPDETWLDVTSENVRRIMKGRLEKAREKGCDAVDPDNIDGYVSFALSLILPERLPNSTLTLTLTHNFSRTTPTHRPTLHPHTATTSISLRKPLTPSTLPSASKTPSISSPTSSMSSTSP